MAIHTVGSPSNYGGDDNPRSVNDGTSLPPTHGRETKVYQELQDVRLKYDQWLKDNLKDLFNDELVRDARKIQRHLDKLSENLDTPL